MEFRNESQRLVNQFDLAKLADSFLFTSDESDQDFAVVPDFSLQHVNLGSLGESGRFFGTEKACPERQIAAKLVRSAAPIRNIEDHCSCINICLPEKHRSLPLKVRKRRGESGLNRTSFRCVLLGRIPGRRRWWWNDRRTVVASNSIGQFPRGQPGSGSAATIVAAEIDQRELRPGRSEVERTAIIDANGAYVAGAHVLKGCQTAHPGADHR